MEKKKILIVDDEKELVEVVTMRLRASGFEVVAAFDGESGLAKVEHDRPDLVILDIVLPKMDGFAVCSKIKKNPRYSDIPVILLTAKDHAPTDLQIKSAQAEFLLMKPFEDEVLLAKIRELLRR